MSYLGAKLLNKLLPQMLVFRITCVGLVHVIVHILFFSDF